MTNETWADRDCSIPRETEVTGDVLSIEDYRAMFARVRGRSYQDFIRRVGSQYSAAYWSGFAHHKLKLTFCARNEIRRAAGLPEIVMPSRQVSIADLGIEAAGPAADARADEVWRGWLETLRWPNG